MQRLNWMGWWLAGGFALVAITIYWSLSPAPVGLPDYDCDKCGHVAMYFVLMIWFSGQILPRRQWRLAAALITLGIALELLQGSSGWRMYELFDIAANAVGIGLAWIAAWLGVAGWTEWVESKLIRTHRG